MARDLVGTVLDVTTVAVNDSTDTEITFSHPVKSFIIKMRGGRAFQWRATNNATPYFSFELGEKMESKVLLSTNYQSASLGFVRSVDGSDTAEVLVSF